MSWIRHNCNCANPHGKYRPANTVIPYYGLHSMEIYIPSFLAYVCSGDLLHKISE